MGEMIIHLEVDPKTQKKNIRIKYRSDSDALPMEHEEEHRRLVDQLIEGGALKAAELGTVTVERENEVSLPQTATETEEASEEQAVEQKA